MTSSAEDVDMATPFDGVDGLEEESYEIVERHGHGAYYETATVMRRRKAHRQKYNVAPVPFGMPVAMPVAIPVAMPVALPFATPYDIPLPPPHTAAPISPVRILTPAIPSPVPCPTALTLTLTVG
ncbi:hypothetical protein IWW57_000732 [Coemansia sp. S610]|nr:hypothetical protein IWW57_000732 [Coemansia sp. S610]KAJ2411710.1 hypothetical protein GGI10_004112 [Coemansia sp. RSA 2530]